MRPLNNYRHLSDRPQTNRFLPDLDLSLYSLGLGSLGLPGDVSSQGPFVRLNFFKAHSVISEGEDIGHFFHLLQSVYQQKGATFVEQSGKYEYTIYTSCVDMRKGIYYYKTYGNSRINGVNLHCVNLDDAALVHYDLQLDQDIQMQN